MTSQDDGTSQYGGLRAANEKVSLLRIAALATQRLFRFPVATATGVLFTWIAASLAEFIPLATLWGLFLRLFVSVTLGFQVLVSLLWLSSVNSRQSAEVSALGRWRSFRDIVAASAVVGLLISVPTVATVWLIPPYTEALSEISWLVPWAPVSTVCLGALFPVSVLLPTVIAWPLAVRHKTSFWLALHFVLCLDDNVLYSQTRFSLAVALFGSLAAFTPLLCLLVIPWLMHLAIVLADAVTDP
jgi:hypothetical protein